MYILYNTLYCILYNNDSLTSLSLNLQEKVGSSNTTTNVDFPEGSFDGLMQAMVCKTEIRWQDDGFRLIVVATDAPFHIAGDGLVSSQELCTVLA